MSTDEDFDRNVYLKDSIFVVYSIYVIYIRCGCGLGLVCIYIFAKERNGAEQWIRAC